MTAEPEYDTIEAGRRTSEMWLRLASQIADAIPDLVINDDPAKAVLWATCAEACFWKATGEADTHDVKDVLAYGKTP
jgi:S-adenosylmethionine synthetase